ncbi:MAG: hypothetical protein DRJ43_06445 [Thermoprotei archaeon]|nr:MAG: hypothetical protein DRJ43_06445 [Thermoprotei archaeon]
MANWNLEGIFQALVGFISAIVFIYQKTREGNLLIKALLEKMEKVKSSDVKEISSAISLIYLGSLECMLLLVISSSKNIALWVLSSLLAIFILAPFFSLLFIPFLNFTLSILGKKELEIPIARLWCLSLIIFMFTGSFYTFIFSTAPKISSGIISLDIIVITTILILCVISGYLEYNRIKIEAINRFLKKNTIIASLCLTNKDKIKGRISQVEKDKVVISRAKTSTWINQKDILYLELFE